MKETPLVDRHQAMGARMVDFAGYLMPLSYTTISQEHDAVRNEVGVFDVSHMGELVVKGREALDLVQMVTSNDASKLEVGQAQYSCMPTTEGGIVDDLLVYRLAEDQCAEGEKAYMLVVNASNIEKDFAWISQHNHFDTRLINISDSCGLLAIQGPKTAQMLQEFTDVDLSTIPYYQFRKGDFAGRQNVLISATGYTGAGGFELYGDNRDIVAIWDALFERYPDLQPVGLGARDTLRLEMGYCLYGNDINDQTSPLEAGLGWITKLKKGNFVGRDFLTKQKSHGTVRRLMGFMMEDKRVPRPGYDILDINEEKIGVVTSGSHSPTLDKPIGLGYIDKPHTQLGNNILISTGRKMLNARITKLPFVEK